MDLEQFSALRAALEDQEDGAIIIALEDPAFSFFDADVGHAAVAQGPTADVQEQVFPYLDPRQPRTIQSCMLDLIIPASCYLYVI